MPGVRTDEAERRFVTFELFDWVGTSPFRGLDAPLALLLYTMTALGRITHTCDAGFVRSPKRFGGTMTISKNYLLIGADGLSSRVVALDCVLPRSLAYLSAPRVLYLSR